MAFEHSFIPCLCKVEITHLCSRLRQGSFFLILEKGRIRAEELHVASPNGSHRLWASSSGRRRKQTLIWTLAYRRIMVEYSWEHLKKRCRESGTGQREEGCNAVSTKVSANPIRNSVTRMALHGKTLNPVIMYGLTQEGDVILGDAAL